MVAFDPALACGFATVVQYDSVEFVVGGLIAVVAADFLSDVRALLNLAHVAHN